MKMLICDDDSIILRALEFRFKKDGFEIIRAVNGRDARKIITENDDIDVMVTDLHMPIINGLELLLYVRQTLNRDIPILVLTRVNVNDTILQAMEMGANDYVTKPFNPDEISNKVKLLLNNKKINE